MCNSRPLLIYLFHNSWQKVYIKFAGDWIRAADLGRGKRHLYQLNNNHYPIVRIFQIAFDLLLWTWSQLIFKSIWSCLSFCQCGAHSQSRSLSTLTVSDQARARSSSSSSSRFHPIFILWPGCFNLHVKPFCIMLWWKNSESLCRRMSQIVV